LKYLALTFATTYACWGGLAVLTQFAILEFSHPIAVVLHMLGGFAPPAAALCVLDGKISTKRLASVFFEGGWKGFLCCLAFALTEILTIGLSSMEINPAMTPAAVPIVFIQAVFIYGGNEELGWRGVMQPLLERRFSFSAASLITGVVWSVWHLPLWFVNGASQQNLSFVLFLMLGILLSFFFAAVYKRTRSVFYCALLHGLTNTLLSVFVIKVNWALITGLVLMLAISVYLGHSTEKQPT